MKRRSILPRRPSLILVLALAACAPTAPPSLPQVKADLIRYVDSRRYEEQLGGVADRAAKYLRRKTAGVSRPALVLDVDETSLSNWPQVRESGFCYDSKEFHAWVLRGQAEAIRPVLGVYRTARELGAAVFFVTGRREEERTATEDNLRAVGFDSWEGLDMRPHDDGEATAAVFKTSVRRRIEEQGYTIVANVGDQESDLAGGHAMRTFKLPNPFYEVP